MAEVGDSGDPERALGALDEELVVAERVEDGAEVTQVISPRPAVNQNVVKKYQDEAAEERPEHIIHQGLECRRGVAEAERHHKELVQAIMCTERRLVDVLRAHAHLVITRAQVQLGEELSAMELVEELLDHRDREGVLDRQRVERAVVDAESP
jgi:hypothetical protein